MSPLNSVTLILSPSRADRKDVKPLKKCAVQSSFPEIWENNPYLTNLAGETGSQVIECAYPAIDDSNRVPAREIAPVTGSMQIPNCCGKHEHITRGLKVAKDQAAHHMPKADTVPRWRPIATPATNLASPR